ncbi:hypothetical protein FZEAL_2073 [Fusarium zealandicum]|uniref:IDI-2 n=1 Tax=Fusarium zealandicum TaxID=1053134 RepID=A0A8H4XN47_9HYPO|nr:hypothetical protein FZEAL_2073 [Fusarium zealandicum]
MKLSVFSLIAYHTICILSMPTSDAEDECGALGDMDWSKEVLPDYVDRNDLGKCRDHPLNIISRNENKNILHERTCSPPGDKEHYGCGKEGFCWINCGRVADGERCWEAFNHGCGAWSTCKTTYDCFGNTEIGARCSVGSCEDCGCGC